MIIVGMDQPLVNSGAVRLDDWGLIRAQGADASTLLQGLLTQDIVHLGDAQATLAGLCSPKGRLLASFVVWRAAADDVWLACSADLLAPTLGRLSKFVLRAKCKLSDASTDSTLYGLAGDTARHWLGEAAAPQPWAWRRRGEASVIRLPDAIGQPRFLLVQPAALPVPSLPALAPAVWPWLEVCSGVARITAATVEQFVPQMVNFELVGGVNFQKGCYPGQEVVARSQYRGTIKRRATLVDADARLYPGQDLFHSDDPSQPAGMVVNAAPRPGGGSTALIEVKLAAMQGGTLHAGAPGSTSAAPLVLLALPYPIPAETD